VRWRFQAEGQYSGAPPTVANGVVYVPGTDLYALDATNGSLRWQIQPGTTPQRTVGGSPMASAVANGVVYVSSDNGILYALSAADGSEHWHLQAASILISPLAVASGVIYFGSDDHYVYALNATDGSLHWKFQAEDWVKSLPLVANGVVYVGAEDDHLYALSA
jgi:eukaryotic-like serine/threonine-protein kinase